jgi:hypothetical protein
MYRYGVRRANAVALAGVIMVATVNAQPATRRATNIAALIAYPSFFHQRAIVLVGKVETQPNGEQHVSDEAGSVRVIFKGSAPDGLDEVRGEFWDLGRMKADEPRLAGIDVRAMFHIDPQGPWPRAGEVTAIMATAVSAASPPSAPSIRAIVLNPNRYLEQKVTITGQYAGRNLLGDLPDAPAKSRYDFVLRSTDAAVWVSNMRPKGKDFDLSLDARIDTGRWLQVTGTVQHTRGLQWIDAEAGTLAAAKPPTQTAEPESIRVPAGPPPDVVFSTPTQDESDVALTSTVRIQFSRDIDQATLKGRIRATYLDSETAQRGEPDTPKAEFAFQYTPATRVLQLRFAKPLERFRTLKVELLEGILGSDQQPLKPWTLTFGLGGT